MVAPAPHPLHMRWLESCCSAENDTASEVKANDLSLAQFSTAECPLDYRLDYQGPLHPLTEPDVLDLTMGPPWASLDDGWSHATPRQRSLKDRIKLPKMLRYPEPPGVSSDDPEHVRQEVLLRTFQEFVLELHQGLHMTQLTPNQDYSDLHCQILDDLQTLKVELDSGCIVEFPLCQVSKVYRMCKSEDKPCPGGRSPICSARWGTPRGVPALPSWGVPYSTIPTAPIAEATAETTVEATAEATAEATVEATGGEHIVVTEFTRRKLAFVFDDVPAAQHFYLCIELLVRWAHEARSGGGSKTPRRHPMTSPRRKAGPIVPIFATLNELDEASDGQPWPNSARQTWGGQAWPPSARTVPDGWPTSARASAAPNFHEVDLDRSTFADTATTRDAWLRRAAIGHVGPPGAIGHVGPPGAIGHVGPPGAISTLIREEKPEACPQEDAPKKTVAMEAAAAAVNQEQPHQVQAGAEDTADDVKTSEAVPPRPLILGSVRGDQI